jgi:hypothetical protein
MELGPSELALLNRSLDPLRVDLLLTDCRRWIAYHRDRKGSRLCRLPWGEWCSVHVDI